MYSGLRMSEVIYQVTGIPFERIAVLSGPNLAREIAGGQAAASVVAPDETAPHDGGRTGAQKAARPSFSCSDLSHVIRGSVSTRCRGTRQVSRREFLSGPLRRGKNGSFLCTVWAARPGGQHPRGDPPRVAGDHDQHRRPPDLAEAQRDVRGREPQVALADLARLIDGPRGRIRGPTGRPQIPDPVLEHGQAAVPADPLRDHRRRHLRHCSSSSRICGSTASTIEPFGARWYFGGASSGIALRTVFLEVPNFLAMARTGICSAL